MLPQHITHHHRRSRIKDTSITVDPMSKSIIILYKVYGLVRDTDSMPWAVMAMLWKKVYNYAFTAYPPCQNCQVNLYVIYTELRTLVTWIGGVDIGICRDMQCLRYVCPQIAFSHLLFEYTQGTKRTQRVTVSLPCLSCLQWLFTVTQTVIIWHWIYVCDTISIVFNF